MDFWNQASRTLAFNDFHDILLPSIFIFVTCWRHGWKSQRIQSPHQHCPMRSYCFCSPHPSSTLSLPSSWKTTTSESSPTSSTGKSSNNVNNDKTVCHFLHLHLHHRDRGIYYIFSPKLSEGIVKIDLCFCYAKFLKCDTLQTFWSGNKLFLSRDSLRGNCEV